MKTRLYILLCFCALLLWGCRGETETQRRRIHLLNPWSDATPEIHGEHIGNWKKDAMVQEEACGWFVYEWSGTSLGLFRFLKGGTWDVNYGAQGMGSVANFNVDSLLADNEDIWIDSTPTIPVPEVNKPQVAGCDNEGVADVAVPPAGDAAFPFPHQSDGAPGTMPQFQSWTHVQTIYEVWRKEFLVKSGDLARVTFDDRDSATADETANYSVSEGIGYGMLISVFLDNGDNDTRADFDGLWAYYQQFADANGLMNWKTSGFDQVVETGSATDADLDAALALICAYLQWGDEAYRSAALGLIDAIRLHEVNGAGFLKPGDAWDGAKNPSYVSLAALRAFAQVDTANTPFWDNVVAVQVGLLQQAADGGTGLFPNWCDEDGSPADPGNGYGPTYGDFGFDAVRTIWRTTWDWLWFGDVRGADLAGKAASWAQGACGGNPAALRSVYTLDGTPVAAYDGYTAGPAVTGAFAVAAMTDPDLQPFLDALYGQLRNQIGEVSYYHTTLQVLYAALLTGNMPNPLD